MGLGAERAAQLEQYLKVERTMSQLKGALGNSTTARQLADLGVIGNIGAGAVIGGGAGGVGSLFTDQGLQAPSVSTVLGAMAGGMRAAHGKMNVAAANRVAEMLVSQDPKVLKNGIEILRKNQMIRDAFDQFATRLSSVVGQQAGSY